MVEESTVGKNTTQQNKFLDVFIEECYKNTPPSSAAQIAKEAAGYSIDYSIDRILTTVQDELVKRCGGRLAMSLPQAIKEVTDVMTDPGKEGSRRILEAATIVMDRTGLIKREQSEVTVKAENGILLIPPKTKKD